MEDFMDRNGYFGKKIKMINGAVMAIAVTFTSIMAPGSIYAGAAPSQDKVDLGGTYSASLGVRTGTQNIYRMAYYHKKSAGSYKWKHLAIGDYSSEEYQEIASTFTDVKIKGNGKYTVKLENADFRGETAFSKMQVSTNIPNTGEITFSDLVVKINGIETGRFEQPYIDQHEDANGNCCLLIINNEREDFESLDGNCVPEGQENKITVTFKVKGFNYKKGEKPKPVATQTPKPSKKDNKSTPEPEKAKETKAPVNVTSAPADNSNAVVDEELRPVVILSIIAIAVVSIIGITFSVTRRKK